MKEDFHAAGGRVTINGAIGGDASVAAGTLELGPKAQIAGKLSFRGGELQRDPAAQVTGGVVQHLRDHKHRHEYTTGNRFARGWLGTIGLVVLAALLAAALPGPSRRMAQELRDRPWVTTLLGYVGIAVVVGGLLLDRINPETAARTAARVGAAVLAMLALALLARLPYVGHFIAFVALTVGVGAIVAALWRRTPQAGAAQPG